MKTYIDCDKRKRVISCLLGGMPRSKALFACGADHIDWRGWLDDADGGELLDAEKIGADTLADSLLDIHDALPLAQARLASDNIKWLLGKRHRADYGDKVEIKQSFDIDIRGILEAAQARALTYAQSVEIEHNKTAQPAQSLALTLINDI